MVEALELDEVDDRIGDYDGWERNGDHLEKRFELSNFQEALDLVNGIGEIAESIPHHPDICIENYREVFVSATTHRADGISENDFQLIDGIEDLDEAS